MEASLQVANPNLNESQVWTRLETVHDPKILIELQKTGEALLKDEVDRIKIAESKGGLLAGYGTAICALLVSNTEKWAISGDIPTILTACCAALTGFLCALFAVFTWRVVHQTALSMQDWLHESLITTDEDQLQRFRIFRLAGLLSEQQTLQVKKSTQLCRAQLWLTGSVACLAVLLVQVIRTRLAPWSVVGRVDVANSVSGHGTTFGWVGWLGVGAIAACGIACVVLAVVSSRIGIVVRHGASVQAPDPVSEEVSA